MNTMSRAMRTALAGAICLSILGGMLVVHAWPLWTGVSVLLPVTTINPRDLLRGDYVQLDTPATRLSVGLPGVKAAEGAIVVSRADSWWATLPTGADARRRSLLGRTAYVQMESGGTAGESRPVSLARAPVEGRINLRGVIRAYEPEGEHLTIDYGLDRYFMQEGTARLFEDALRNRQRVQMEIAVTRSGQARIRQLFVNGVPVPQPGL
jgi:uncharacterized membrane-anchored protein